jgi:uncharacterized membrane protein YhaH (DUF805 family)
MNDLLPAAFRSDGRIGRQQYWVRICLLLIGGVLLKGIGAGIAILSTGSPRYVATAMSDLIGVLTMLGFVLLYMLAIVLLTLIATGFVSTMVGRLHDRGKSGWRLVLYCVLASLLADTPQQPGAAMLVPLAAGAVLIWELIDLGIMPGRPAERSGDLV